MPECATVMSLVCETKAYKGCVKLMGPIIIEGCER
jgi:hypothetical protein